jgi:glycosyltransferase involved in cell wall biosynthesis
VFETASVPLADRDAQWPGVSCWTATDQSSDAVRALQRWNPDVIFVQGIASPGLERALMSLAPSVCFAHSYYGTCISGAKMHRSPQERCCERRFGVGCLLRYYPMRCGGLSPVTLFRQYERQNVRLGLLREYHRIIVASRHMAAEYARHDLETKVRVVPLPIASSARPVNRSPSTSIRLLYLGRLELTKGAHIAVDSAALVAAAAADWRIELQMSGEGSCAESLRARASRAMARCANFSVTFSSWLGEDQCAEAIDRSDLLLVPSCWPEPFGMVGVEAALRGVPAVAFAVGGIPEWLSDGLNGKLVAADPPNAPRFAEAILACLSDGEGLARMRERSRTSGREFGVQAHVSRLNDVFREAMAVRQ